MKSAERLHLSRVASLGCIVCRITFGEFTPAEIHHPRAGMGMSQRASHFDSIPLCHVHHRTGGYGLAIHSGQKTWEAKFGTETELLDKVRELLA